MKTRLHLLIPAAGAALMALAAASVQAHDPVAGGATLEETVTTVLQRDLPNAPGKQFVAIEVDYPPGGASPSHRHPASAFIYAYVLSGEIVSAVDGEEPRTFRAGESWQELPGAHHRVSRNGSTTKPARLLAIFVTDPGESQLVHPDPR